MDADLLRAAGRVGAALAAGLVVGLERGWRERTLPEGGRVAGLRTFTLIGLLGGLIGVAGAPALLAAAGLAGVAALFAVAFHRASQATGTLSITTAIAGLVTLALGLLAGSGQVMLAVGTAAVTALLLRLKGELHSGLRRIEPAELTAVLQLAVLTAAILPLLPDAGYGPYGALNPFRLWVAVVLVAALSLSGHVAQRLRGAQQGLLWVGLLGGLASSTAATLSLARAARGAPGLAASAAAGIVAACGVMFLRMAVVVTLLRPVLALRLGGLLVGLGIVSFCAAAVLWRRRGEGTAAQVTAHSRVFDLPTALAFGLLLGAVAVLVRAAQDSFGQAGVYGVAFLSGLVDVDAIVISSVQMHAQGALPDGVAVGAILLAVVANMVLKAAMAWTIGGRRVGVPVVAGYLAVAATGLAAALLQRLA